MLPITLFLADKVFSVISLLEKNRLLLKYEKRSFVTPPPSNVQETFPVAKSICESSLIIILAIYLSANFALAPCTGVTNFTRDGNAIISENYIVIVGEKVLLWP